ncbi:MAG: isoprenylcysteine carboxylmethyltransferase family protein [Vicinamibacterales bacterium]
MRAFAWAGALLFAGALAWFAYRYFVIFGTPVAGVLQANVVGVNVALFTAFAFHHTLFARTPLRRWIFAHARDAERSIYVWVASLLFIAVCTLWVPLPGVWWTVSGPAAWLLRAAQLFGVVLTLRGAAVIDVWDLAGMNGARDFSPGENGARDFSPGPFSTTWPYGWVRHPIYLGWFLLVWPVGVMTTTRLVFAAVSSAYLLIAIPLEEGTLRRTAPEYDEYRRQVRWRVLPGVY